MGTLNLNRLFGKRKRSDGKKVGKATERGLRRALDKFIGVEVVLTLLLLLTSVTPPPTGYAAFPGTNGKIVFASNRDGNEEIYVMNDDGSGQTRLTFNSATDRNPDWQPLPTISVEIDIKPGSYPNCFNSDGHGAIPVAILSSTDFDATQVDPLTVSLNGQGVRIVGKGNTQAHVEDVNSDGLDDLVVQIEDIDGTYTTGDTTATLTGETFGGIQIQGTDSICVVP